MKYNLTLHQISQDACFLNIIDRNYDGIGVSTCASETYKSQTVLYEHGINYFFMQFADEEAKIVLK